MTNKADLFDIVIWVCGSGHRTKVVSDKKMIPDRNSSEWRKVTFTMRVLTWGANNQLQEKATVYRVIRGMKVGDVDWVTYRELKFIWAVVSWQYEDGEVVEANEQNIGGLHEAVMEVILKKYDEENYLSKSEKNRLVMEVDNYIKAQASRKSYNPPVDIVEESLYRTYQWTPQIVDAIPLKRLQRLFTVVNQRDTSVAIVRENKREKDKPKINKRNKP